MKRFYTNVINDKRKNLSWKNSNFFYITSLVFITTLIISFLYCRPGIEAILSKDLTWNILLVSFAHSGGWVHLFGNCLSFFVVSLYFERKFGSLRYLGILLMTILLSPLFCFLLLGMHWHGESLVNYFLFGLFFVDILVNFKENFLAKNQNIFVIIIIFLICLLSSFTIKLEFGLLITLFTVIHGSAFIEGAVVGIFANLFIVRKNDSLIQKLITKRDK